jgi:tetratricopeptide (TPR) repeat protein
MQESQGAGTKVAMRFSVWQRVLALFLVAVLFLGLVLSSVSQIAFRKEAFEGSAAYGAAQQLLQDESYLTQDQLTRIRTILNAILGGRETSEDYETLASIAIARERYDEAVSFMEECLQRYDGNDASVYSRLLIKEGCLYALKGDYAQAVRTLDTAKFYDPSQPSAYLLCAQIAYAQGDAGQATAQLDTGLSVIRKDAASAGQAASIYEQTGRYDTAAEMYSVVLQQEDLTEEAQREYRGARARVSLMTGGLTTALEDCDFYFSHGGEDAAGVMQSVYGLCLMNGGKYEQAAAAFETALADGYTQPAALHTQLTLCYYAVGAYEKAIASAQAAIEGIETGEDDTASGGLGSSSVGEMWQWIGRSYMAQGEYAQAEQAFTESIAAQDTLKENYYDRGVCRMAQKNYRQAAEDFTVSLAREEEVQGAQYDRGICRLQLGELEKAQADLKAAASGEDAALAKQAKDILG